MSHPPAFQIHLALFLSRATPLQRWEAMGILERETALYRRLAYGLSRLSIVSSGNAEELAYQGSLGEPHILYNRWGLSPNLYSLLAPFLHRATLREASVFKTNQLDGAWTAIIAGMIHRKPVIVRAGYLWAESVRQSGQAGLKTRLMEWLQRFVFTQASTVVLTTAAMREQVLQAYALHPNKVHVIPNFVDTDLFVPSGNASVEGRISYVGRLEAVKNIDLLIEAMAGIPGVSLSLIGQGTQRQSLEDLARARQVQLTQLGTLPNTQVPDAIRQSTLFVLPSKFEGHPKALLEAMSCAAAVLGTDVPGIRELIRHGETGWLCQPDPTSIREAIQHLLDHPELRAELGRNARRFVLDNFSLERVAALEFELLQSVAARQ